MKITKRTLERWRSEALSVEKEIDKERDLAHVLVVVTRQQKQILALTQELIDQELVGRR